MADEPVRVFISYVREDHAHGEAVRRLWLLLRSLGVDAKLDLPATRQRQYWPEWMTEQLREAAFVLVVASPSYRERGENRGDPVIGRGARWESRLIQERLYADANAGPRSVLPVVLPGDEVEGLPDWLLPAGGTVYTLREITGSGVERLLRTLTDQPMHEEPPLGQVPTLPPRGAPEIDAAETGPERAGLVTEVLIDVRLDDRRLISEVFLADAPVCAQEEDLPAELDDVWTVLSGPPLVAGERLSAAGRALGAAVFDPAGQHLVADLVAGLQPGDEVEVVWRADGLALGLPVELLELTTSAGESLGPLALSGGVSVRRQVSGPRTAGNRPALPGPLRVLAAVAAPDETRTANAPLDVEAEMQALMDAVADPATGQGGEIRILEVSSLSQIEAALRESGFHVLHLSAHGSATGVELEDEDGAPHPVGYRELMTAIRDAGSAVPLIVLSSCAGAAGGGRAMAAGLIGAGADRVLAMQARITDQYATRLLAEFYRNLSVSPGAGVAGPLARARRAVERARRADEPVPPPEYAVATLLCAGADRPLVDAGLPPVALTTAVLPSGTSVRELGLGQLIGRRAQLREATAVLRRTREATADHGLISGVQLIGVGGIGKTALAGRLVTRLRGDGMAPVVHEGRWNPTALFAEMAVALATADPDDPLAALLASPDGPDTAKTTVVAQVLNSKRAVLVFDDFEQNLSPGGAAFLDPAFDEVFTAWCEATGAGVILVTCRYPLPGDDRYLVPVPVGPLSAAELRRLLLRRPALHALTGADRLLLIRTIGGHPRLIEYVDALLRGKPAQFREVQQKLRALAAREGIDLRKPRPPGTAIENALLLGGADILLDELLTLLTAGEREVLLQLSVSRAPMTLDDLAHALTDPPPEADLATVVDHLTDLTLLVPGTEILVHPWTAELLERRPDPDRAARHQRAYDLRMRRARDGRLRYEDLIDLARHLAATDQYDRIPGLVGQVITLLAGVLAAAAYLAEIRPLVPPAHPAWFSVAKLEFETIRNIGDMSSAGALLHDMRKALEQRQTDDPHDNVAAEQTSILLVDLGDLAITDGDLNTARDRYHEALMHDHALPASTRNDPWWHSRPGLIRSRLGNVARAAGDLAGARDHYQASLDITQRLAAADPDNTEWQRDLSISREKLGDIISAGGDIANARDHYQASLDIRQRLATADPDNNQWQRDLSISRERLGDIAQAAGDLISARDHYQASLDITQRLAAADPRNSEWQRDLSVSHNKLGDVTHAAGDLTSAGDHYQAGLDIRQRLVTADSRNSQWQRDLSVSHNKLGNVAHAAGDLTSARDHYQAGMGIAQQLAAADPGNTEWQRDLSISHNKLGDVTYAAGDLTSARYHYQAGMGIAQRLAAADPSNSQWQRDLSISHNYLGDVNHAAGDLTSARDHYQASLDIAQRLAATDPSNSQWQRDLSISHNSLGDVTREAGDLTSARDHYQASLDIAQRLSTADPGNSQWQELLAGISEKLNDVSSD